LEKLGFASDDYRLRFCKIANPLSEEISILRSTLLTGIIDVLQTNVRRQNLDLNLFEIGRIFINKGKEVPEERLMLAGAMMGKLWGGLEKKVFSSIEANFYILKEILSELLSALGQRHFSFETFKNNIFHHGESAKVVLSNEANEASEVNPLAAFGLLHPRLQSQYDFPNKVYIFEIDLTAILIFKPILKTFTALPRFPSSTRDLSILVSKEIFWKEIEGIIKQTNIETLDEIDLFDCYEGEGIPQGQKSLAFHLIYRACDRTLTDEEVNSAHQRIVSVLQENLSAKIR
jgi:phenylalanyl-tRNA synthetase beta chain